MKKRYRKRELESAIDIDRNVYRYRHIHIFEFTNLTTNDSM